MKVFSKLSLATLSITVLILFFFYVDSQDHTTKANLAVKKKSINKKQTNTGLIAYYDFKSSRGDIIKDRSGIGKPVDLKIANVKAVRRSTGSLEVRSKTIIRSVQPATKINQAIKKTGAFTLEAWVLPSRLNQSGPARIVTLSKNSGERNFTLGQDGNKYEVRFRSSRTSTNGLPSLGSQNQSLTTKLTHIVYSRNRSGRTKLFLNGKKTAEKKMGGDTNNWNQSFHFALANELSNDRAWLGTYYSVAIYNRDLSPDDIFRHFKSGANNKPHSLVRNQIDHQQEVFETEIASLLANHCLECHDASSHKGGLDLSQKVTAFKGGKNGPVIQPGKADDSLLWKKIISNEMPANGSELTTLQKKLLKDWINNGAVWSIKTIDPAHYMNGRTKDGNWVRRLTVEEYIATVQAAVGVDITQEARSILPEDLRADGFSNTAYNLNVDLKHVDAYAKLAEIIVAKMDVMKFAARFSKSKNLSTDATMRKFVESMGKWLLRGDISKREERTYSGIATTVASAGGDYKEAVSFIIEAMLQSPRFIYRIETQQGDGGTWQVNNYELASRISYFIWGCSPDKELMFLAEKQQLFDRSVLKKQVEKMLKDPRAKQRSSQFIIEWLDLNRLDNMNPNKTMYPHWKKSLAKDMRKETLAYFQEIVWKKKRPLSDLMNAQFTYLTPELAKHYGINPQGKGLVRYDLSKVKGRGGLLTQGSLLTIGGDEALMVTRGLFVLQDLLRGVVKDPPPGVDTTPTSSRPGRTQRSVAETRISTNACGGCHSKFEPLAFGLEKFDGLGAFQDRDEHGNKLREDGEILFPGNAKPIQYTTSAELMTLLANSERVKGTITWKMTQYAIGRPLTSADVAVVEKIHTESQKNGGTYTSLVTAIVMSDLILKTKTEKVK